MCIDIKNNYKKWRYHTECCDKYEELLGNIKKYGLFPICDWSGTYITDLKGTRINHIDDDEHIMLFDLTKEAIRLKNLTANELKEKLVELYGF